MILAFFAQICITLMGQELSQGAYYLWEISVALYTHLIGLGSTSCVFSSEALVPCTLQKPEGALLVYLGILFSTYFLSFTQIIALVITAKITDLLVFAFYLIVFKKSLSLSFMCADFTLIC